jgi:hypothetical protein
MQVFNTFCPASDRIPGAIWVGRLDFPNARGEDQEIES